jgi:hypothetical protein
MTAALRRNIAAGHRVMPSVTAGMVLAPPVALVTGAGIGVVGQGAEAMFGQRGAAGRYRPDANVLGGLRERAELAIFPDASIGPSPGRSVIGTVPSSMAAIRSPSITSVHRSK